MKFRTAIIILLGSLTLASAEPLQTSGPYLAQGKSKFLGSVYSSRDSYNEDFEFYWNGMWQGNSGKWGSVEGVRDYMNWGEFDQAYNFAKEHGVIYQMHVLLWGNQQPNWIYNLSDEEQLAEIREWFQAVADRYPDMDYVQVVNEPVNDPPDGTSGSDSGNYAKALGGTGETGFDWIINAFRLAREIFPGTPLMINEYNVEGDWSKALQYVKIINKLKEEGLIDAVGIQGHAFSTAYYSVHELTTNLDYIASTGLPIMVTEMEIDGLDDQVQLAEYQRVFPIYWEHPAVIGINLSGHRVGNWRTEYGAYIANEDDSPRPAFIWLRHYVQSYEDWFNFDVTDNWAATNWLGGPLYVPYTPWIWSNQMGWVYVQADSENPQGAWTWIPR
mgnify:CR=1 FL=1